MATPHRTRLTVIGKGTKSGCLLYRCSCGTEKQIRTSHVRGGKILSCGCLNREITRNRLTTHGGYSTPEHRAWSGMINRCHNPAYADFARWGGRGIAVCSRWRESFAAFLEDVGPRPSPAHSIDRIDNDRGYEPGNVRWATVKDQANNRRSNVLIELDGEVHNRTQWAAITGLKPATIRARLLRGWSVRRAITEPERGHRA